jgi:putative hydrolase of HD superfamily
MQNIIDFLFEVGGLAHTPRSGLFLLGTGEQSVAEHLNRVTSIGYVLCTLIPEADENKVLKMCLFHDLAESRTSDLNYVNQKYATADEDKALTDIAAGVPFGEHIKKIVEERNGGITLESKIAKDADQFEWAMTMKEQADTGNSRAIEWMDIAIKRLKTPEAKALAEDLRRTDSIHWWFFEKDDPWWVSRNKTE